MPVIARESKEKQNPFHSKSFMKRITDAINTHPLSQFRAFPSDIVFLGQEHGEKIVLVVRQHVILFFKTFVVVIGLIAVAVLATMVAPLFLFEPGQVIYLSVGVVILCVLFSMTVLFNAFIKWFYTVSVITTQRIIDMDFNHAIKHTFAETQLERVEQVYHEAITFWSSIFDYGNVFVETAGSHESFRFMNVPRPRDIEDTIFDLLELKQKGKI